MGSGSALRKLPAVGALLAAPEIQPLISRYSRSLVTEAARRAIEHARRRILAGEESDAVDTRAVERELTAMTEKNLRRVINGTGVVLHTNMGRAPLAEAAKAALIEVAEGYSNLELDLATGKRGSRHDHVRTLIRDLLHTEDALCVNNCAGAVMLMLGAICQGKEVIVSRGELVEIGGGFRVPDVMRASGAEMIEVGTTNKVYVRDYEAAITPNTAAILVVHRSNFAVVGFTHSPEIAELSRAAQARGLPLLVDVGSGLLADDFGEQTKIIGDEPRPRDVLEQGAHLVAFSGDKLLGGPQAGIVAGRATLIERLRKHPLSRALRADKLSLAALEATLRLYQTGRLDEVPTLSALRAPIEKVEVRAEALRAAIAQAAPKLALDVEPTTTRVGGGALPLAEVPSYIVVIGAPGAAGRRLAEALRQGDPAVVGRIVNDRVAVDVRSITDEDVRTVARCLGEASQRVGEV